MYWSGKGRVRHDQAFYILSFTTCFSPDQRCLMCLLSAKKAMFSSSLKRCFSLSPSHYPVQSKYLVTYSDPSLSCWWGGDDEVGVSVGQPQPFAEKFALALCLLWAAQGQNSSELEAECVTQDFTGAAESVLRMWLICSRVAFGAELVHPSLGKSLTRCAT